MRNQILKYTLLLLLVVTSVSKLVASKNTYTTKLQGAAVQNGGTLLIKDDQYDYMQANSPLWPTQFKNVSVKNFIHLKYTGADTKHYTTSWFVQTIVNVQRWDANGVALPVQQCTLRVTYNPAAQSTYTDVSTFETNNAHKVLLTIVNVTSSFASNAVPSDVLLDNEMVIDREFNMNPTQTHVIANTNNNCVSQANTANDIEFHWDYMYGADEYDLEWMFVSDYDNTIPFVLDFSNATRITTTNQYFKLNLVFDNGKIYYRIRGVARDFATNTKRLEGEWTIINTPIQVCNTEHRNWTYNATYAEDGKKKEVVAYFDGSQRNRQTVTLSNTENVALISENIYDYEGRAAIQTLPAPAKNTNSTAYGNNLLFYQNLNLNQAAQPYSKKDFDKDALFTNCSPNTIPGMLSVPQSGNYNMGSSYYYSDQNVLALTTGFGNAIPDANDYPFTQVLYTNKGTVKMQSGVGNNLNTGSGHETQFLNATASQEKLDRLFGNEVGYAEHYSENITIDPNGQIAVAYKDLSGKVIATAMRGDGPNNLIALNAKDTDTNPLNDDEPYMVPELIKEDFSGQNQYNPSSESYVIAKDFPVTNLATTYNFSYEITPQVFHSLCTNKNYNCKYLMQITITDECGAVITENSPSSPSALNTLHAIDAANYTSSPFTLNFAVTFPKKGIYKIIKTLSLDPIALQQHLIAFEADLRNPNVNTCITPLADLEDAYELGVDMSECNTCEQNCDAEADNIFGTGPVFNYDINNPYIDPNGNSFNSKADFVSYCKGQCAVEAEPKDCDALLQSLKDDMSPGGQYFEKDLQGVPIQVIAGGSINFSGSIKLVDAIAAYNSNFFNDFTTFLSTNGYVSLPAINTNFYTDLSANWDPHWAEFLVQFHPEYCRYQRCTQLKSSFDYNVNLLSLDYTEATTLPNTTAPTLNTAVTPIGTSVFNNDPFFLTVAPTTFITTMSGQIGNCTHCAANFPSVTPPSQTMWDWATVAPTPITSTPGSLNYNNDRWSNFRQLYLSEKAQLEAGIGCPALPDITNPADNLIDNSTLDIAPNGYNVFAIAGLDINDPEPINNLNVLASNPVSTNQGIATGIASNACIYTGASFSLIDLQDGVIPGTMTASCPPFNNCTPPPPIVPALQANECSYVLYVGIPFVPVNYPTNMTSSPGPGCYIQISNPINLLPNWQALSTPTQIQAYYAQIKAAIDNYISTPYDFSCQIIYSSGQPIGYKIIGPASLGLYGNNMRLKVVKTCGTGVTAPQVVTTICSNGTFTGASVNCEPSNILPDCICTQLVQIGTMYNDPSNTTIDHTTYPTIASYAAHTFSDAYGLTTPLTTAQVQYWITNCTATAKASPLALNADGEVDLTVANNTTYAVPVQMDCNPEEPCQQQGMDEADFYAGDEFEGQIQQALQDFITQYKAACLNKTGLNEQFRVNYTEKEYHYTLYYYDQAGNLVRTVPPRAVNRLTPAQLYSGNINLVNQSRLANTGFIYPNHSRTAVSGANLPNLLVTNYKYNTLNQLVEQTTPDAGLSRFWYNSIGQLRFSQNAKQVATPCITCNGAYYGRYSYTNYDAQGRIIEVGENEEHYDHQVTIGSLLTTLSDYFYYGVNDPLFPTQLGNQVTKTYYDVALSGNPVNAQFTGAAQQVLRKRVASVSIEEVEDLNDNTYDHATHYSYDVHGNVFELVQENPQLASINHNYKKTQYKFDLISGKVNRVTYQKGQLDQMSHVYFYDADNRITNVYTSDDNIHWQQDARYFYYLHGPLARTELGDDKVQGSDYAYTIQGWIKNVNTNTLQQGKDVGVDGNSGFAYLPSQNNTHKNIAQDIYGYSLNYFTNDYQAINTSVTGNITGNLQTSPVYATSSDLFNGNIKAMSTALYKPNGPSLPTQIPTIAKFYNYDQLNRIQEAISYTTPTHNFASLTQYATPANSDYYESFRYDADGNIKFLKRNAYTQLGSFNNAMDNMTYVYNNSSANNKLDGVTDVDNTNPSTNFGDIKDQTSILNTPPLYRNYDYDDIGNLKQDIQEQIDKIEWTVYGKIKRITRLNSSTKSDLEFMYDASGNRVSKLEKTKASAGVFNPSTLWITTYYSRDAQGNVLAVYNNKQEPSTGTLKLYLTEQHLYGSSRLGLINKNVNIQTPAPTPATADAVKGIKYFELSNHLSNVLTVITDRKLSVPVTVDFTQDFENCTAPCGATTELTPPQTNLSIVNVGGNNKLQFSSNAQWDGAHYMFNTIAGHNYNVQFEISAGSTPNMVILGELFQHAPYNPLSIANLNINYGVNLMQFTASTTLHDLKIMKASNNGLYEDFYIDNITITDITPNVNAANQIVGYYTAEVVSSTDYYAFGAPMPGRNYTSTSYKYGFNGMLKDDEIAQGIYTAEYWEYDSRIGRRWNTDPIVKYWESPYACFKDNPIYYADPSGLDGENPQGGCDISQKDANSGNSRTGDTYTDNTGRRFQNNGGVEGWQEQTQSNGSSYTSGGGASSLSAVGTGNNTINNAPRIQYSSQFVFELSSKIDIGAQMKVKAGVASAKIDLVSFELAKGKLDFAKMFDNNQYADNDDSVTGSHIFNGDGNGVNVESSLELEAKLPFSTLGQDIGLGVAGKQTFNTNNPGGTVNRDYDVLLGVTLLKKTTDQAIGRMINKNAFDAMGGIDPAGSIKGKVGKKQEFEGLDLGFGAAFILGFDINFKLGHVYTEK